MNKSHVNMTPRLAKQPQKAGLGCWLAVGWLLAGWLARLARLWKMSF